jgi:hypothetical protein
MRGTIIPVITLVAAFAGVACEDGPSQTFTPEPVGAGNVINGPGGGALSPDSGLISGQAHASFDASFGGSNANILCTAAQVQAARKRCFGAPISPPGLGACLDIAGGPMSNGGSGWEPGDNPATYYNPATETWTGATVEQAEAILCQATPFQFFQGLTNSVAWGDQAEVGVLYNTSNRQITDILLQTGYEGGLSATSVDGKTTYTVNLNNTPPTETNVKTGATTTILLDWNSPAGVTAINVFADALYDALRNKYSPTTPSDEGCADPVAQCCVDKGDCVIGNNGTGGGYFFYTPLGLAIFVNTTVGSIQANSTFTLFDQQVVKELPFATSAALMKLDSAGIGPSALASNELGTSTSCNYTLGMKFSDFNSNCVDIFPTNTAAGVLNNTIETRKLFGALNHTDETFIFSVLGLDPNFSATLGPDQVVADLKDNATGDPILIPGEVQEPGPNDTAYSFNIDQYFVGVVANDFANNDATQAQDWHGIGLVTLETAYLVQKYMQAGYGVTANLGDPGCIANPVNPGNGKVCSGLEGVVTSAPPASVVGLPPTMAFNAVGAGAATATCANTPADGGACSAADTVPAVDTAISVGLKPGTWYADFCTAGAGVSSTGAPQGYVCTDDYYFTAFQNAVAASFPPGTPIPATLGDRRFFFQQWILAFIKYMHVANNPNATLAMVDAAESVTDDIYFDSQGGGFESGAYVDRTSVNTLGQAPTVLTIGTNLTTSVMNNFDFTRFNTRGETALYTALTTTAGDKPGYEPQYVTNLAGSPVLQAVYGSYACATNTQALTDNCPCTGGIVAGQVTPDLTSGGAPIPGDGGTLDAGPYLVNCPVAPVDVFGNPIYAPYAPAFGHSFLNIAANGSSPTASAMKVTTSPTTDLIQSAIVTIPIWANPFDPTTATPGDKTISALVPYMPQGADVGFPVTIDGSRDKFYNTFNVDFSGTTGDGANGSISASVDYEILQLPTGDGGTAASTVVRAIETTSYLGLVFMCNEGTDILQVRMYDNADEVFAFLAAHPDVSATQQGAQSDCGIEIKYSVYGNYADYISSNTNGVRLGFTPGFGGSVVTDVTLFDPNVVAALGQ